MLDFLFDTIIGGLEVVSDAIEFGPFQALSINSELIPQAERDRRRIMSNIDTPSSSSSSKGILDFPTAAPAKEEKKPSQGGQQKASTTTGRAQNKSTTKAPYVVERIAGEVVNEKFTISRVTKNISAALHEFDIDTDDDRQISRCFIIAFLKYNDLADKDIIDTFLYDDEDKAMYIQILRWFSEAENGNPNSLGKNSTIDDDTVAEFGKFTRWELSYIKEVLNESQALQIQNNFKSIMKNLEKYKAHEEPIIVDPIITVQHGAAVPKTGYTQDEKEAIAKSLNEEFKDILSDYIVDGMKLYKFNVLQDIAELVIVGKDLNGSSKYRIDPNLVIGNGVNLIYYINDNRGVISNIFINVKKHPALVKKIFDNPTYPLTLEEAQQVLADTFTDESIYYYIDMGSFSKYLNSMKPANVLKLENKLSAVSKIMAANNGIPAARLRLKEWKGLENFVLVSDGECRSPLGMQDATSKTIASGLTLSVVKDKINVTQIAGKEVKTAEFTITSKVGGDK